MVNHAAVTATARRAAGIALGPAKVITAEQSTAGDDVTYFNHEAPGCYFLVGSPSPDRGLSRPHQHHEFGFGEGAPPRGQRPRPRRAAPTEPSVGSGQTSQLQVMFWKPECAGDIPHGPHVGPLASCATRISGPPDTFVT